MSIETPKQALEYLITRIEQGEPMLILAPKFGLTDEEHEQLPTIHNFYPKKYYESIDHHGFGFFEGATEHGKFNFDAGGAMQSIHWNTPTLNNEERYHFLAWSPLRTDNKEVLADLGYDLERTLRLLKKMLSNVEAQP